MIGLCVSTDWLYRWSLHHQGPSQGLADRNGRSRTRPSHRVYFHAQSCIPNARSFSLVKTCHRPPDHRLSVFSLPKGFSSHSTKLVFLNGFADGYIESLSHLPDWSIPGSEQVSSRSEVRTVKHSNETASLCRLRYLNGFGKTISRFVENGDTHKSCVPEWMLKL